jgi:hypothetical protein
MAMAKSCVIAAAAPWPARAVAQAATAGDSESCWPARVASLPVRGCRLRNAIHRDRGSAHYLRRPMLTAFASNTKGADVESFIDAQARCSDFHVGQRPGGSVEAISTLARRSDPVASFAPRTATSPARAPVLANCLTARGQNDPISGKTRPHVDDALPIDRRG